MLKLSIISVNLNDKTGLEKTIRSVINQNFHDYEFIVIDGDSTDGSKEIINKYESNIDYWVSEKDSGIYNAMNKGIIAAKGEYLLFLNSGDFLINDEILNNNLFASNSDIIIGGIIVDLTRINSKKIYILKNKINAFFFSRFGFIPHQSTFIKKDLFSTYGLYDESYRMSGDYEFFMRILLKRKADYTSVEKIISVYNDFGISSEPKYKRLQNSEYQLMIKQHSTFPLSLFMLTIFSFRKLFREPIRKIAMKLNILQLFHKISVITK